jgi:hypothetical protein
MFFLYLLLIYPLFTPRTPFDFKLIHNIIYTQYYLYSVRGVSKYLVKSLRFAS